MFNSLNETLLKFLREKGKIQILYWGVGDFYLLILLLFDIVLKQSTAKAVNFLSKCVLSLQRG